MDSQLSTENTMQPDARKLVTVVTEAVLERDLVHALDELGVPGYTITDARGKGARGDRAADWEHRANIRVEIVCDAALVETIIDRLQGRYYDNYAMVLYVSDVTVLRPEKFEKREGKS